MLRDLGHALPPDLLASERGSLDHVISVLAANPHGQLLVAIAAGRGRVRAGAAGGHRQSPGGLGEAGGH